MTESTTTITLDDYERDNLKWLLDVARELHLNTGDWWHQIRHRLGPEPGHPNAGSVKNGVWYASVALGAESLKKRVEELEQQLEDARDRQAPHIANERDTALAERDKLRADIAHWENEVDAGRVLVGAEVTALLGENERLRAELADKERDNVRLRLSNGGYIGENTRLQAELASMTGDRDTYQDLFDTTVESNAELVKALRTACEQWETLARQTYVSRGGMDMSDMSLAPALMRIAEIRALAGIKS